MEEIKRKRILAFLFDAFSTIIIGWLIGTLLLLQGISIGIVNFVVFFLLCKDCLNGASLGKRMFKLQVIDSKTLKVATPLKCIFRNFCYTLWIVELPYFLCKSDGRRVGDYLAGTNVVSGIKPNTKENRKKTLITLAIASFFFILICAYISCLFSS